MVCDPRAWSPCPTPLECSWVDGVVIAASCPLWQGGCRRAEVARKGLRDGSVLAGLTG